jgi:hypothetical protein
MVDGDSENIGVTNYYIAVYSRSGCTKNDLVMLLWFFDSRGAVTAGSGQLDDFVAPEVHHSSSAISHQSLHFLTYI